MSKIRIGYLPLYIKLYDDSNPHYRDPMVAHMKTLISMLESQGLEVVAADVCRVRPEFDAAARLFNEADVDAVVTQHHVKAGVKVNALRYRIDFSVMILSVGTV